VSGVSPARFTILLHFETIWCFLFVFCSSVVSVFTFCTSKYYELPHLLPLYSIISVTTPAPTVLPPSLMAKRSSFSRAMGVTSSTLRVTLSPGITISTPSGSLAIPVTSVVLR